MRKARLYNIAFLGFVSGAGALIGSLYEILPLTYLKLLLLAMLFDILLGISLAFYERRLNSSIMQKGLLRKSSILLIVMAMHIADVHLFRVPVLAPVTAIFFTLSELLSILEKGAKMGIPIPAGVRTRLERLRGELDSSEGADQFGGDNVSKR